MRRVNLVPLLLCFLLGPTASAQRRFQGTISAKLQLFPNTLNPVNLKPGTAAQRREISEKLESGDDVLVGTIAGWGRRFPGFRAALVRRANGTSALYVDVNRDGRFSADERHMFRPTDGNKWYQAAVRLALPLHRGPYTTLPVLVGLPAANGSWPSFMRVPDLVVDSTAVVDGVVPLPGRQLRVAFAYDPGAGTVQLASALEWMDMNGDGKLNYNNEREFPSTKPPVFHVGNLYLKVTALDLAARTFTLQSVPASEDARFDLVAGSTLPDFAWTALDGSRHQFSDVHGKYRLIDFWAIWCEPCIADLASLKAAYTKYHSRGFEILGVDGDAKPEKAQRLLAKRKIGWPQARYDGKMAKEFAVGTWPTLLLVDSSGKVESANQKSLYGADLDTTLERLLGPPVK